MVRLQFFSSIGGSPAVQRSRSRWVIVLLLAGYAAPPVPGEERRAGELVPSPEDEEFFEKRVRPVLAENCARCHGATEPKAGLRLDSREGLLRGRSGDPVVVPGRPEESRLVRAIRHRGEIRMPPKERLPDRDIAAIVEWVRRGAPWPRSVSADANAAGATARHWAFQPVGEPRPPAVKRGDWPRNELDRFVLRRLEDSQLAPAPPADRRTLIRRLSFDLHGLPPDPGDVHRFLADTRNGAWARLVDRFLASPRYGERWGRHWLDIARYADTKGYVFTAERRFPFSYTYRDWVIGAFNDDLPYDRFLLAQIAGDRLDLAESDRGMLAAMGFLTLGRRFLNNQHDIIDDRIDVVTRGTMALTVQCARCHDHKYDPIPMEDYYSLYGVFQNSLEPGELPLIAEPEPTEEYERFRAELAKRERQLEEFTKKARADVERTLRSEVGRYLLAASSPDDSVGSQSLGKGDLKPIAVARWRDYLRRLNSSHPVFGLWIEAAASSGEVVSQRIRQRIELSSAPLNAALRAALRARLPESREALAAIYTALFRRLAEDGASATGESSDDRSAAALAELRALLFADGSPTAIPNDQLRRYLDRATRGRQRELRKAIDTFRATSPAAPARAMVLVDRADVAEPRVFLRGNPRRPGDVVPRRFLAALSPPDSRPPFVDGSGRLELARAIVNPDNPLTARVFVNRVWKHHFGQGLVRTLGDFGTRSDPPTHPELLDWLARRFVASGWSMKELHRTILLSASYQQSSVHPDAERVSAIDPENRLLSRATRRRLEFEPLRDALLSFGGQLDLRMGGASVDVFRKPFSVRRSVYAFIERQNLPGVLRVFDFASPDATSPGRHVTTVPQQALYFMNGDFAAEQARHAARREELNALPSDEHRVSHLYRLAYSREPTADELGLALAFIDSVAGDESTAWERLGRVLLFANEFVFVD